MLDWRVDTFLDVCETLNYTHTARRLSITQPAVSQHISWLEKQLGVTLFDRCGRSLVLTDAGKLSRDLLLSQRNDEARLKQELVSLKSKNITLVVGATLTAGEFILAEPLARWCAQHPFVDVRIDVADTAVLLQKLDNGLIDCALVEGIFDSTKYSCKEWSYERMICVENPNGANYSSEVLGFTDLLDETLLIREAGSGSRAVLEAALARKNLVPSSFNRVIEANEIGIVLEMVTHGFGITFAYESAVQSRIDRKELREIKLYEEGLGHSINFVWQRDSFFSDRFERLFSELKELA